MGVRKYATDSERKDAAREQCRKYRATDRAKQIAADKQRVWQSKNKHKPREYLLRNKYGLTIDNYKSILAAQNNKCAICEVTMSETFIDHDHYTGLTRGILCRHCNLGIGHFFDSIETLNKAIKYLSWHL